MNKINPRYELYLKAGGEYGNNWRFMQFISCCWNMYGKEIEAHKCLAGSYKFTKKQKDDFTPWLEGQVDNGLTEQFTCNLGLQMEGR